MIRQMYEVFQIGQVTPQPLMCLYRQDSVTLFFSGIAHMPSTDLAALFPDRRVNLVHIDLASEEATGSGLYTVEDGKITVIRESGTMKHLLDQIHFPQDYIN